MPLSKPITVIKGPQYTDWQGPGDFTERGEGQPYTHQDAVPRRSRNITYRWAEPGSKPRLSP